MSTEWYSFSMKYSIVPPPILSFCVSWFDAGCGQLWELMNIH